MAKVRQIAAVRSGAPRGREAVRVPITNTHININSTIWIGNRSGYGSRPEYHAGIAGSQRGATRRTSICPRTRAKNSPMQIHSAA